MYDKIEIQEFKEVLWKYIYMYMYLYNDSLIRTTLRGFFHP